MNKENYIDEILEVCPFCAGSGAIDDGSDIGEICYCSGSGKFIGLEGRFLLNGLKQKLQEVEQRKVDENTSDGYHTFKELYEFRKVYNACLFNEWANGHKEGFAVKYDVHKSKKHFDGEDCFGGGWFIVVAILPTGQISNHYELKDWDLFNIPEVEKAKYEFDGHTPKDVLERLKFKIIKN